MSPFIEAVSVQEFDSNPSTDRKRNREIGRTISLSPYHLLLEQNEGSERHKVKLQTERAEKSPSSTVQSDHTICYIFLDKLFQTMSKGPSLFSSLCMGPLPVQCIPWLIINYLFCYHLTQTHTRTHIYQNNTLRKYSVFVEFHQQF